MLDRIPTAHYSGTLTPALVWLESGVGVLFLFLSVLCLHVAAGVTIPG